MRSLLAIAVLALGPAVATADAAPEMFVQSARTAEVTAHNGDRATLVLQGTPATVMSFQDRPLRGTSRLAASAFADLWIGPFRRDPPNAALVGVRDGHRTQVVVELLSARSVPGGMRYRIRMTDGRPPRHLSDVSLFVDPLAFPPPVVATATDTVNIPAGTQMTIDGSDAGDYTFASVTIQPGASLQINGASTVLMTLPTPAQASAIADAASTLPRSIVGTTLYWSDLPGSLVFSSGPGQTWQGPLELQTD
jgi:hypothetical protein